MLQPVLVGVADVSTPVKSFVLCASPVKNQLSQVIVERD